MIHYAKLENSPRLQRLLTLLQDGQRHSTMDIITKAKICAVNTAVSELRRNGYVIGQEQVKQGLHEYYLIANAPPSGLYEQHENYTENKELF